MRQISQAYAHTCNFLMCTIFYLQLHALLVHSIRIFCLTYIQAVLYMGQNMIS